VSATCNYNVLKPIVWLLRRLTANYQF